MASASGTSVQQTFKLETKTMFARAAVGSAGAVTLVTADGASKLASISKEATGKFKVVFSLPVQQFLGSPIVTIKNSTETDGSLFVAKVIAEDAGAGSFTFDTFQVSGSAVSAVANPPSGSEIQITSFLTTSPVF